MSRDHALPDWLARFTHDLRGPLAPLQTAAYLLRSGALETGQQAELFEVIDRQTQRLARMLDEIDDWTRADQGRLLDATEDCEADALLALALEGDAVLASVETSVAQDVAGVHLRGDPRRLVQMMRAIASPLAMRGVAARRVEMRRAEGRLRLDVMCSAADGIVDPDALLESPLPDPHDEGLGLRLMVARAIAEAHGGSLAVERVDGGIRLRCELPAN